MNMSGRRKQTASWVLFLATRLHLLGAIADLPSLRRSCRAWMWIDLNTPSTGHNRIATIWPPPSRNTCWSLSGTMELKWCSPQRWYWCKQYCALLKIQFDEIYICIINDSYCCIHTSVSEELVCLFVDYEQKLAFKLSSFKTYAVMFIVAMLCSDICCYVQDICCYVHCTTTNKLLTCFILFGTHS